MTQPFFSWMIALALLMPGQLLAETANNLSPELQKKIENLESELEKLKKMATAKVQDRHERKVAETNKPKPHKLTPPAKPSVVAQKEGSLDPLLDESDDLQPVDVTESTPTNKSLQTGTLNNPMTRDEDTDKDFSGAEQLYQTAQIALNQRDIAKATKLLTNLCTKYPDAPQFMLAKYWLGESYLEKRDYTNASISYGESYTTYKKSLQNNRSVPDIVKFKAQESLLKLAYCLKMLKKKTEASLSIGQFYKEFSPVTRNLDTYAQSIKVELACKKQ